MRSQPAGLVSDRKLATYVPPNFAPQLATFARGLIMMGLVAVLASILCSGSRAGNDETRRKAEVFETPELAISSLAAGVRTGTSEALLKVLGSEAEEIISSGDPVADQNVRAKFIAAFDEAQKTERQTEDRIVLVIGQDEFPFPIPLVKGDAGWHFDAKAGKDEILDRRIGANELRTIATMRAYVQAQREYASADRDGKGVQYAQKLLSSAGKRDGLYWPVQNGEPESPLGPLIADARAEGYAARSGSPAPYHGYLYRILKSQGSNALGGAINYVAGGRMIGGFGLIAVPAAYGNSGVMTFVINHDGVVYQQDLGPETPRLAATVTTYDPGSGWIKISDP